MSEQAQHTPGPWICKSGYGSYSVRIESEKDGIAIGSVHVEKAVSTTEKSELPYGWANAQLIAAAPDLLAALEAIKERLAQCANLPVSPLEVFDSFYQEIVDSAIAKARGQS